MGDVVSSVKTLEKSLSGGKISITASDLDTDNVSDWTVLEVLYGGHQMLGDISVANNTITIAIAEPTTSGGVVHVTLAYEKGVNISEEAQLPPVVVQGAMIDENDRLIGNAFNYRSVGSVDENANFSGVTDG